MRYLGSFILQDMLLSLHLFAFGGQNMKFSESKLAFYVTCAAVCLKLFTSWGFFSWISFLALFGLMRVFFEDAVAIVMERAEN